jgi:ribosomal-protein-alanine N-acetyltransferase
MPVELITPALRLLALSPKQLEGCLVALTELEAEMGLKISRDVIDDNVKRAIALKLGKMRSADIAQLEWYTYWLIIIDDSFGAGFIGFKGPPDTVGEVEIGYGIDPLWRNKGYITEAAGALRDWAFSHPGCCAIKATAVKNPASSRVMHKLGAVITGESSGGTNWRLERESTSG